LSKNLFSNYLGTLNLNPIHSFEEIRDASVGSHSAGKRKAKKEKKRKLDFGHLEPTDNPLSDTEIRSEASSNLSNISEELADVADMYHELINSSKIMRRIGNFLRGSYPFQFKIGKPSKVDLAAYRLYRGSDLTITDLCILLNALTSRSIIVTV
jgi:hypothetical protein